MICLGKSITNHSIICESHSQYYYSMSQQLTRYQALLLPKLRRQFAEFLQRRYLKHLSILYQSTCVGLGYGLYAEVISCGKLHIKSIQLDLMISFPVTFSRPRNINLVPIGYGVCPDLRDRLTPRGLTLRGKPWTFGEDESHIL